MNNFFSDLEKIEAIYSPIIPEDIFNLNLSVCHGSVPPLCAGLSKETLAQRLRELHLGLKATWGVEASSTARNKLPIHHLENSLVSKREAKVESEFTFI
jgi:hypothetical protein